MAELATPRPAGARHRRRTPTLRRSRRSWLPTALQLRRPGGQQSFAAFLTAEARQPGESTGEDRTYTQKGQLPKPSAVGGQERTVETSRTAMTPRVITGVVGFTHRSLRTRVATLLATPYSAAQMSYDLTRLRRKGLIQRLPGTNTYVLTADGVRFALFYTKVHDRLLVPLLAADTPPAPPQLRQALGVIDRSVTDYVRQARLQAA